MHRVRVADGTREQLFVGSTAQEAADGGRLFYTKLNEYGIFARSLEGELASNPEERIVDDYWYPPSAGFQPVDGGLFYVGYTPDGTARAIWFFDFAQGAAKDVLPLSVRYGTSIWGLTVAPDHRELLFASLSAESGTDLVQLEF